MVHCPFVSGLHAVHRIIDQGMHDTEDIGKAGGGLCTRSMPVNPMNLCLRAVRANKSFRIVCNVLYCIVFSCNLLPDHPGPTSPDTDETVRRLLKTGGNKAPVCDGTPDQFALMCML